MTREQAIKFGNNMFLFMDPNNEADKHTYEFTKMAVDAILKLYEIEIIISMDNSIIQEDVFKYKMICEVIKYEK